MSDPVFSVVMPCHDAQATLAHATASAQAQTLGDIEIILIDDGSRDATRDLAQDIARHDRRVRVIAQRNAGPAAARNAGIAAARAKLLAFLDADDAWAPTLLAAHAAHFARRPEIGISFARVRFFDPALRVPGRCSAHVARLRLARMLGENPVCTTSNLAARAGVFRDAGLFDTTMRHAEDQEFIARVLAATSWQAEGIDEILVQYRTSPGGLSADLARMEEGWRAMIARLRAACPAAMAREEARGAAIFHRYIARRALRTGQNAARPMLRAWRASPAALLTTQPARSVLTTLGAAAALIPGNPARALLAR